MEGNVNAPKSGTERQAGAATDFGGMVETSLQQLIAERGLVSGRSAAIELNSLTLELPAHTDMDSTARATAVVIYRILLQKA